MKAGISVTKTAWVANSITSRVPLRFLFGNLRQKSRIRMKEHSQQEYRAKYLTLK